MTDRILEELDARRKRTRTACSRLREKLRHSKEGRLRVVVKKGKGGAIWYQYYVSHDKSDAMGRYLPKAERSTAAAIAQRDYETALLDKKCRELAFLEETIKAYVPETSRTVYDALHPGRRCLVTPEEGGTSDQAVIVWKRKKYTRNPYPVKPSLMTDAGIPVRSKSEVLIANALYQAGLPFRYEYPIRLPDGREYFADFYILNPATGAGFAWEHFGRMDDPEYCAKTIRKISDYTCFLAAKRDGAPFRFLMTFEDKETPLKKEQIETQIARILE